MKQTLFIVTLIFGYSLFAREPLTNNELADIISQFQYDSQYTQIEDKKKESPSQNCWTYQRTIATTYPNAQEPLEVNLEMFVPNRDKLNGTQAPLVVVIPPIGGVTFLDRGMARTLCNQKMAAIIVTNDFANVEYQSKVALLPPEDHQKSFFRISAAIKATVQMSEDDSDINADKTGIFGVSLGGILGSFVMSTQSNISVGYFIVAGGDIPHILAYSEQGEIKKIRQKRMTEQNLQSQDEYEDFLRQHITFDPLDTAATMLPATLQMVVATKDKSVPSQNQEYLYEAFGKPKTKFYKQDHLQTILSSLLLGSKKKGIAQFFSERFKLENPRPEHFDNLFSNTQPLVVNHFHIQ